MAENLNTGITVQQWAKYTIDDWVKRANAMGILPTDPTSADRFVHHILTSANGDPEKIQFMYDYWLNFVDWGVGKGVTLEHRDMLVSSGATSRKQKRWFTEVFYYELGRLNEIMAKKYALKAAHVIVETSSSKITD